MLNSLVILISIFGIEGSKLNLFIIFKIVKFLKIIMFLAKKR